MPRGRKRQVELSTVVTRAAAGILDDLPGVEELEARLRELDLERMRIGALLHCIRQLNGECDPPRAAQAAVEEEEEAQTAQVATPGAPEVPTGIDPGFAVKSAL